MLKDHERPRNNEHPWSPDCGPKILPTQTDKQKQGFYEDSWFQVRDGNSQTHREQLVTLCSRPLDGRANDKRFPQAENE